MKAPSFGSATTLVIVAALLPVPLTLMGLPRAWAAGAPVALACAGFALQMWAAFSLRRRHVRDLQGIQRRHRDLMDAASKLPPNEAVALLLEGLRR